MQLLLETNEFLDDAERARLRVTLGCAAEEEAEKLSRIMRAAFGEYLTMLLGTPVSNRAEEVREKRLLQLLRYYAQPNELLTEQQISAMFQLNDTEARRLLRSVRAKYRVELDARVANAAATILENAVEQDSGDYRVQLTSENVLEALRLTVTIRAPQLDQIVKVRGSAGLYDIPPDTYAILCQEFDAT